MPIKYRRFTHFQLWQIKVGNDSQESDSMVLPFLSNSEVKRLSDISSPRRKREYLLSRTLIRYALKQVFALPFNHWDIIECNGARFRINNLPTPVFYSLSHSDGEISFVMAPKAIGIDIEVIKSRKNLRELAQQFMHVNELNCLGTPEEVLYFYRTWSAKEAYFKALSGENQLSTVLSEIQIWPLLNNGEWQQTDLTDEHFSRIVVMQA